MKIYWVAYIYNDSSKSNVVSVLGKDPDAAVSFIHISINKVYKTNEFKIVCCSEDYGTAVERLMNYGKD